MDLEYIFEGHGGNHWKRSDGFYDMKPFLLLHEVIREFQQYQHVGYDLKPIPEIQVFFRTFGEQQGQLL